MGLASLTDDELEALDSKGIEALSTEALERLDQEDAPEASADLVPALGRLNESVASKAVEATGATKKAIEYADEKSGKVISKGIDKAKPIYEAVKPVLNPMGAVYKKADEFVGDIVPKEAQGLLASATGFVAGKVADEGAEMLGGPEIMNRYAKGITAGAITTGGATIGGGLRIAGIENIGNLIDKVSKETAANLAPPDPNITDAIANGIGSMGVFMIPGAGVTSSARAMAVVAPRLAQFLGAATSAVLEAAAEAGSVYSDIYDKTGDRREALVQSTKVFGANVPFVYLSNKLGWASEEANRTAKVIESFFSEGAQEGGQRMIQNFAQHDPVLKGAFEEAFVGGIVGGGAGLVTHGMQQPVTDAPAPVTLNTAPIETATLEGDMPGVDVPRTVPEGGLEAKADQVQPETLLEGFTPDTQEGLPLTSDESVVGEVVKGKALSEDQKKAAYFKSQAEHLRRASDTDTNEDGSPLSEGKRIKLIRDAETLEAHAEKLLSDKKMFLKFEDKTYPVASEDEAAAMFGKVRDEAIAQGMGSSDLKAQPLIVDEAGKTIGVISWNGKILGPESARGPEGQEHAQGQQPALAEASSSRSENAPEGPQEAAPTEKGGPSLESIARHPSYVKARQDAMPVMVEEADNLGLDPEAPGTAAKLHAILHEDAWKVTNEVKESLKEGKFSPDSPEYMAASEQVANILAKMKALSRLSEMEADPSKADLYAKIDANEKELADAEAKKAEAERLGSLPYGGSLIKLIKKHGVNLESYNLMHPGDLERIQDRGDSKFIFRKGKKGTRSGGFSISELAEMAYQEGLIPEYDEQLFLNAINEEASGGVTAIKPIYAAKERQRAAVEDAAKSVAEAKARAEESSKLIPPEIPQDMAQASKAAVSEAEAALQQAQEELAGKPKDAPVEAPEPSKGRLDVDAKMAEAAAVRAEAEQIVAQIKDNEKEIARLDAMPGKKSSVLIAKIAQLQAENLNLEKQTVNLGKQVSIIEAQAAALREAHDIEDLPVAGLVRKRPKGYKGGGSGASSGDFAMDTPVEMGGMEHIKPFRMPEMVRLAYELMGKVPDIKNLRAYNGYFKGVGGGEIKLNPIIFQKPEQAAKTLAHEIGHLIDYLPDHTLKRGNLLGRLQSLRSHLANEFGVLTVTNKEIRDELLAVTMYWRPYDPATSSKHYNSYRKEGKELYADAISMLFNTPGTLERMAPKFYKAFFEGLDTKPAAKLAFFDLQAFLNQPELQIQEARHLDRKAMYMKAEDIHRQKRAEKELRDTRYGEWFKQMLVDKHQKIIGEVEAAASKGEPLAPSADPRYILEEMSLADNNNHALLEEVNSKVGSILNGAELSNLDLGDYLYLSRVAMGDRQAFANPKGYNPEEATKALEFMTVRLGLEKYAKLEAAAANFREIVYQMSKQAVEVGAYNQKVFDEKIEPNRGTYAVFAVQEHLEDYITAGVKEQIGTLKDIANPFTATVMKMVALNRLIAKQKGANAIRDFLVPRGEATQAEVIARGDKLSQFRGKKGFGLIEMLEDGHPVAYLVDPYIAEAFKRKEAGSFELAVKVLDSVFNGVFRPLYITFNIGFQLFSNPVRDFNRARRNIYALVQNSGYAGTVKSLLLNYANSLGTAGRRAAGIDDQIISEMIANKSLDITFTDYSFDPEADQYTSVLRKMGMSPAQTTGILDRASKIKILKPIVATLEAIRFMGNTFETISKVAGYKVLKADSLATLDKAIAVEKDAEVKENLVKERALLAQGKGEYSHALAYNTRNYVGTPNWRRKGTVTKVTNSIFPFSNIMIQGFRSDLEIATRPTTRTGFMLDMTISQVFPKLLMFMAAMGGAGDELAELFRKVSEYDKSNYLIVPLGFEEGADGHRKAVYARIPHDESGRLIAAVMWKMLNGMRGDPAALSQIVDLGAGQLPKLSPPLNIGATWVAYLSGKNPYDAFRGRSLMSDKVFRAGGIHSLKKMVQWTANSMGLSSFTTYDDSNKTNAEAVLQYAPLMGRIFKISDYGEREEDMKKIAEKQSEDARRSLDRGAAAKSFTKELYILTQKKAAGEISSEERNRLAVLGRYRRDYNSYSKAIKRARNEGRPDDAQRYEDKLEELLSKVIE